MNTFHTIRALAGLYKIMEAGEKGYAVAASNVNNRALKALFKTSAQQRLKFKQEILAALQQLGYTSTPRSSFLGMIHRGRIDIFAALTIGAENAENLVLKEVLLGEKVALRTYEKTLAKGLLPEIQTMIQRQFLQVSKDVDRIRLLRGENGKRLVLRLYDSKADAERAVHKLREAGFSEKSIEFKDFNKFEDGELYEGRGSTILETILSGAVGGATWGVVAGALAVIGIIQMSAFGAQEAAPMILLISVLGLITAGTFIGSMLGLFIGWGIASDDDYVSGTLKRGQILVRAFVEAPRASRAWNVLNLVALEARVRHVRHAAKSPA